ncbi:TYRO tyrosine kinase-binding -like [Pelobates cultripes]|uniref:TYRO protein tyrosine kinase-binding protein n=1 Tax=Pelobates cultripes TaxID=61616 RepID=A0AAD1T457_PELCU|nr:TYRO tyrosine kinase-binding -like [Pelobates cultripes]
MRPQSAPHSLLLLLTALGAAFGQDGCGDCLRLDSGAVIGIVICDVIITVLIALTAYIVSNKIQQRKQLERKTSKKNETETNDRTYEELRGQRLDIYNDMRSARS